MKAQTLTNNLFCMLTFTNIQHEFRKKNNLSCNEYVMADMIFLLSKKDNAMGGWCYASKNTLADEIGLTKQGVLLMLTKLEKMGFVEKHPQTKYLKTTEKWNEVYYQNANKDSKEQHQGNKKNLPNGKESLPINGKETIYMSKESLPINGKENLPYNNSIDNNIYNNKEISIISGEQVAPLHSAAFSNSNQLANNEIENKETELEIPKISFPLNEKMQSSINVTEAGGSGEAKETFFEGKVNAHLQRRMTKLITTKHHKNLLAPIYEKAHRENGFKPLSNEQQNTVFAKFLAKSFVELKGKDDNYLLPTLRENKPFLCKLIELFESVEWQKKTWKAIELQAKSLVHFDSSPDFCTTLIDRTLKGSAQTASVYLQFYYDFDRTKVQFEAFVKTKQAQGDGQNGNVLGNSFTRNGKTIVFAETYTKERSNERFGMYEGVEYCLTHNGAWLVPMKDDATLQNDVQEWNKTGLLRGLINSKGV